MNYYPVTKKWAKIKQHLSDKELNDILVRDFNKFTFGRWEQEFKHGMLPAEFESCDWQFERKGRHPEYWNYVKHSACHWTVNFLLRLANLVEPNRKWRIITSRKHSTVWDGEETMFDFNFLAFNIAPEQTFKLAKGRELKIGNYLNVHLADHYKLDIK